MAEPMEEVQAEEVPGEDLRPVPPHIRKLARIAQIAAVLGIVSIVLSILYSGYLVLTGAPHLDEIIHKELAVGGLTGTITPLTRWLAFLLGLLPLASGLLGLCFASELFAGYRKGEIFTAAAANRLSAVGWAVVLLAPAYILSNSASVLVLTMLNEPGARHFTVEIDEGDIFALVFGLLIVVVGRILHEAAKMADENKSFV